MTTSLAGPVAGWDAVVGQDRAVAMLRAAVASPVHAYLLVGPRGCGHRAAGIAFAADLLAVDSEDPERARRLAHQEAHPDLEVVARSGPFISADQARSIVDGSVRSPIEGARKVMLLDEFHLVRDAGPILLKAIEEPPPGTHFVVVADEVPPELVTIASRCVRVEFGPVPLEAVVGRLVDDGVDAEAAAMIAGVAAGDLARARQLAADEGFAERLSTWEGVFGRLDGTGHRAMSIVDDLAGLVDAAQAPIEERHAEELEELAAVEERYGTRGSGRRTMVERQRREVRRFRTDEFRFGLAVLARVARDRMAAEPSRAALDVAGLITVANEALERNPNERLLLEGLLVRLVPLR